MNTKVFRTGAALLTCFFSASGLRAADFYYSQNGSGAGTGNTGTCSNTLTRAQFNTSTNWTAGNTLHLCGTFTFTAGATGLTAQGNGTAGNVITILFEPGAILQAPDFGAGGAGILLGSHHDITVDGGGTGSAAGGTFVSNGIIQATLSGTAGGACRGGPCTNNEGGTGINAASSTNITIKNLLIRDIYVRTSFSDQSVDWSNLFCISAFPDATNLVIDNNVMTNSGEIIAATGNNIIIRNNDISNTNHGLSTGLASTSYSGIYIYGNHFHDMAAWDSGSPFPYHHDGIHFFQNPGPGFWDQVYIYNNTFDGDIGVTPTGWIYMEATCCTGGTVWIFNNVGFISATRSTPANLGVYASASSINFVNNTVWGGIYTNSGVACDVGLTGATITRHQNNICQGQAATFNIISGTTVAGTGAIDYNLVGSGASFGNQQNYSYAGNNTQSLTTWRSVALPGAATHDANSILATDVTALALNSNGSPQSTSPARNAGLNLFSVCSGQAAIGLGALCSDIAGTPRPTSAAWDIGAYQFGGVGFTPTSLSFGNQATGTTSGALSVTMTNNQSVSLTGISISIIGSNLGDFAQSNTCGTSLTANATCTISVTFTPTATGARNASIQVVDSATTSPQSVALTGTGTTTGPITSYAPTSLSFPNTNLSVTSAAMNIVLTNTGSANLTTISVAMTGNFAVSSTTPATNCGGTLAVNATCTIAVTFTPASAGLLSGTLRVTSNATSSVDVLNLSGTGVDPTAINVIQTVTCGGQSFPNPGGAACTITATTAGDLLVASGCSAFSSGTSTTISSITDNKSDTWAEAGAARSLDTGSNSICDIWYTASVPAGVTTLTITPSVTTTMAWVIREVANVNTLDQSAVVNSHASAASPSGASVTIATAKEFIASVMNPSTSVTVIHAGNACTNDSTLFSDGWAHVVTASTGTYACQWDLSSAGTYNSSTASFKVSGGTPVVSLSVSNLTFGGLQTLQTSSPSLTVTLTNNGTASLTITSIVLGGTNPGDFSQSTTCGGSLAVNVSCTVTETFKPTAAGARAASIAFTTNATTSPDTVTLAGTAIVQPTIFGGAVQHPGIH